VYGLDANAKSIMEEQDPNTGKADLRVGLIVRLLAPLYVVGGGEGDHGTAGEDSSAGGISARRKGG